MNHQLSLPGLKRTNPWRDPPKPQAPHLGIVALPVHLAPWDGRSCPIKIAQVFVGHIWNTHILITCMGYHIVGGRLIEVWKSLYLQSSGRSEQFDRNLYEYYIRLLTSIMQVDAGSKCDDPDSTEKWVIECLKEIICQCLLCTYSRKPVYEASSKKEHWHLFLEPPQ